MDRSSSDRTSAAWLASGQVANIDQLARVVHSRVDGGPADDMRAIDIALFGGFTFRVLPDRGLDIGSASVRGVPLAWTSAVGECRPLDRPHGGEWIERFSGGLLTTCGLDNVGVPSEGMGQHGTFSHLRAADVNTRRTVDGERISVEITGTVSDVAALGRHLENRRTIRAHTDVATIEIIDVTTNFGATPEPAPILYHVNLGAPFWTPGSTVGFSTPTTVVPRDADARATLHQWNEAPTAGAGAPERVFEHLIDQPSSVHVDSPGTGLQLTMTWTQATLPRFHHWVHPAAGVYALGIEPSNASVLGRAADRAEGRLPVLEPGESRTTGVTITVAPR